MMLRLAQTSAPLWEKTLAGLASSPTVPGSAAQGDDTEPDSVWLLPPRVVVSFEAENRNASSTLARESS